MSESSVMDADTGALPMAVVGVHQRALCERFYPSDLPADWRLDYLTQFFPALVFLEDDLQQMLSLLIANEEDEEVSWPEGWLDWLHDGGRWCVVRSHRHEEGYLSLIQALVREGVYWPMSNGFVVDKDCALSLHRLLDLGCWRGDPQHLMGYSVTMSLYQADSVCGDANEANEKGAVVWVIWVKQLPDGLTHQKDWLNHFEPAFLQRSFLFIEPTPYNLSRIQPFNTLLELMGF